MPMIRRLAAAESFTIVTIVGLGGTAVGTVGAIAYALVNGSASPNYLPPSILAELTLTAATLSAAATTTYVSHVSAASALKTPD